MFNNLGELLGPASQFENRWPLDVARDPHHAADNRHPDHVALLELDVGPIVALEQDVVEVECADRVATPAQFDRGASCRFWTDRPRPEGRWTRATARSPYKYQAG